MILRRYYHRHVRHHQRFHVAVFLTIIAVAWIVVPPVTRLFETVGSYDPKVYEPKDAERGVWLANRPLSLENISWDTLLKVALFIFAGLAWLAVAPGMQRPGRSSRR